MSLVNVANMVVLDNPAPFGNPLQFEITFECLQPLDDDLEWKVVYVGSAKSQQHDQVLDEILVGPVPLGINKFILQADPPNADTIPDCDVLGVTVILVTCSYRDKEFLRVGYYVNNEYVFDDDGGNDGIGNGIGNGNDVNNGNANANANGSAINNGGENDSSELPLAPQAPKEREPPRPLDLTKVVRTILADKPRVTRFQINWGDAKDDDAQQQQQQMQQGGEQVMIDENDDDDIMQMDDNDEDQDNDNDQGDEDNIEEDDDDDMMMMQEEEDGVDNMVATE